MHILYVILCIFADKGKGCHLPHLPVRLVPLDLFPMNEGGCNDAWARNTFRYAYMFTSQIIKESFDETTNDLKTW